MGDLAICVTKAELMGIIAVTLDGTIIHKSGLITGGKSSQTSGKKWEEKDVQGTLDLDTSGRSSMLHRL